MKGTPVIGDDVALGAHAIVIGNVRVGNNAWIGEGSIVTHDVSENGVVYGETAETRRIQCEE